MNIPDLFVVEWSETQRKFHVHNVDEMLRANLECFHHERNPDHSDWMVVAIAESHQAAHACIHQLKASLDAPPPSRSQ